MSDESQNPEEESGQNSEPVKEAVESPNSDDSSVESKAAGREDVDPKPTDAPSPGDSNPDDVAERPAEDAAGASSQDHSVERILGIEVPVTVSFGSSRKQLKEILQMAPGTVLELDRTAEDPVLLKVNKKVFAKGQVVVVDGHYGIKITEVETTRERLAGLGGNS